MPLTRRHLDVGLFGAILLLFALVVRGWMREDAGTAPPPPAPRADAARVAALPPLEVVKSLASGSAVDLLALIRPERDRVQGAWTVGPAGLRSPVDKWARLQLPCLAPEEYDLRLRVSRVDQTDALILGAPIDGAVCQIVLDGNGARGSWLEVKGGGHGITAHGITYFQGPVFVNGRPAEVVVAVRRGRLEVQVDGFTILVWRGDKAKLFVGENWDVPKPRAPFLGAWQSAFVVESIQLASVSGAVDLLR